MQRARGPANELHNAAFDGVTQRMVALLSRGHIDIDQPNPQGLTPIMLAAFKGHLRIVRLLLSKGATVSGVADDGFTALHAAVQEGHPAVTKLLVDAGADLEARTLSQGYTPLYIASERGLLEVMSVLIEAGANPNTRELESGATPLYTAAQDGRVNAVKLLLRAKADPLLMARPTRPAPEFAVAPVDVAAHNGHLGVVHELIQEYGVKGCGGASGGARALQVAAQEKHVHVMEMLTNAGVVDTGTALLTAAAIGHEAAVKLLLQQMKWTTRRERAAYLNTHEPTGQTPLFAAILKADFSSARIVRLLADAGADTASPVRIVNASRGIFFHDTPLAFANRFISVKSFGGGRTTTEDELHSLKASRRVLLRLEAVHATSWLWTSGAPSVAYAAAESATGNQMTPVALMLPILRRRTGRPRVILAAMFRHSKKP